MRAAHDELLHLLKLVYPEDAQCVPAASQASLDIPDVQEPQFGPTFADLFSKDMQLACKCRPVKSEENWLRVRLV